MAARRALERIGMFEGLAVFLDMSFQTTIYIFGACMCDRLLDVCGHMPGAAAALSSRALLPHMYNSKPKSVLDVYGAHFISVCSFLHLLVLPSDWAGVLQHHFLQRGGRHPVHVYVCMCV